MFRSSWYLFLLSLNLIQAQSFVIKSNQRKETHLQANMALDMKTILYEENKSGQDFTSVMKMTNQPIPKAKPGIAVVKVMAVASNPIDIKVMGGFLTGAGWSMPFPFVVGYDFSVLIQLVMLRKSMLHFIVSLMILQYKMKLYMLWQMGNSRFHLLNHSILSQSKMQKI